VGICLFFNGAHRFFRLLISGRVPFVFDLVVWEIFDQKYTNLEIQPVKRREEIPKNPGDFVNFGTLQKFISQFAPEKIPNPNRAGSSSN